MTKSEYNQIMKECIREYKQWLKDSKVARALVKKEATKIRKATLTARTKVAKKKVVKKSTRKSTRKVARKK